VTLWLTAMTLRAQPAAATLLVHEWGTFTSLQNESGESIGGINTDDEPVPAFVHRISDDLLIRPTEVPASFIKGAAPACHPDVTLRLETPVLYFHLPAGQDLLRGVQVTARFRGGWLSEFYPKAQVDAPGVTKAGFGRLRSGTVGTLMWKDLAVGGEAAGPVTGERVWTAPRAVQSQSVSTTAGETEKFLFYRGVAHIDAPIAAVQDAQTSDLVLQSQLPAALGAHTPLRVRSAWLVDIGADGVVAFRPLPPLLLESTGGEVARVSSRFEPREYDRGNEARLRASLRRALVAEGLFDDEAQALLETWKLSYFRSTGMRVFFLVPRAWTDRYLPLSVSVPAQITRVMVGRIELVTPQQRSVLRQIERSSAARITAEEVRASLDYSRLTMSSPEQRDGIVAEKPLRSDDIKLPKEYQLYLSLGRFRNALILDEAARHPTPGMSALISAYGLAGYRPPEEPVTVSARMSRR